MKRILIITIHLAMLWPLAYGAAAQQTPAQAHLQEVRVNVEQNGADTRELYDAWLQVINDYIADSRTIFAMEQLQQMLDYASARQDFYGMAQVHTMYGNLFVNNYSEATKNLDLALEYAERGGYGELTPAIYYAMAKSALNDGRPDEALERAAQMMSGPEAEGYAPLASCVSMTAYSDLGQADKAAECYAALETYWQDPSALGADERDVIGAMLKYLLKNGRSAEAMTHAASLDDSYALSKQEVEAAHYLTTGNLKAATEALSQLAEMRSDVIADQRKARLQSVNDYMVGRKLQDEEQNSELASMKTRMWICLAAAIVLLLATAWMICRMIKIRRQNAQLAEEWQQMDEARQEAERLSDVKSAFIDKMSHELRTPLNSIMGFTEILNNPEFKPTEEKRNGMLKHIHTQSEMLIHLLDNVVMLSRIDAGDIVPNIERVHLSEVIEEVCDPLYKDVPKDVTFNVERGLLSGAELFTDRELLTSIIKAVLENAVKFTQRGEVVLDCATDQDGTLTVSVSDTGDGIAEADAERIYNRFEKLGRIEQGFGLGLSTARQLLDILGGSIALDTTYSRGARFIITVPSQKPQ